MTIFIILIFTFALLILLKGYAASKRKPKLSEGFHKGFKSSDSIISLSQKGKIENVLYIDKHSKKALWCNQVKKKTNVIKEFNLKDINRIHDFEDSFKEKSDKKNIYVLNFGMKLSFKDGSEIPLYFMNDTAYVMKPNYVYDVSISHRREYRTLLKS